MSNFCHFTRRIIRRLLGRILYTRVAVIWSPIWCFILILVWPCRIDCFPISTKPELLRLQLQLYSTRAQLFFFPPQGEKYTWYLLFQRGNNRVWHRAFSSFDIGDSVVKFRFNISDIFAVLMINFFVRRVDSHSFFSGYQPPPTLTTHYLNNI